MAYKVEPIDVTGSGMKEKVVDPRSKKPKDTPTAYKWWFAQNDKDLCAQLLSTTEYLKRTNAYRIRQASVFTRLFSGKPLYNYLSTNSTMDSSNQLPIGRPTANICYSCTDTLLSRITQEKPKPTFLTENGMYKQRKLSKDANQFIQGEFHRTKAYQKGALMFRDGCVLGDGLLKVFPRDNLVEIERTLETELLTDYNDAYYGNPRQLIQMKLVDRGVSLELFPDAEDMIAGATTGSVDSTPRSTETVTDQFIIAEGWHLPSGDNAKDGRHAIACSAGIILDEDYDKKTFPFVKFGYNPNPVGWFSQSLTEILMPTQMEIYRMLIVASQAIELMGVPRIYIDEMSKIMETSFNNRIGTIIKGRGAAPEFLNAISNPPEIYNWIQWLIENGQNMAGLSKMATNGTKPPGLDSGEAQREFMNTQDTRFAATERRYKETYEDLSCLVLDTASDIYKETGKYSTVCPGKNGIREIDFKSIGLLKDSYVIQLYEESSLPKDPEGRQARLSEMLAAGEISNQEFRRLSNFPDLEQSDQLAAALEERILCMLDKIIDDGEKGYEAPDPFLLDPTDLATTLCVNYINKYSVTDIEEDKLDLLRDWFTQVQTLKQAANPTPPQMPQPGAGAPPPTVAPPNPSIAPTSGVSV